MKSPNQKQKKTRKLGGGKCSKLCSNTNREKPKWRSPTRQGKSCPDKSKKFKIGPGGGGKSRRAEKRKVDEKSQSPHRGKQRRQSIRKLEKETAFVWEKSLNHSRARENRRKKRGCFIMVLNLGLNRLKKVRIRGPRWQKNFQPSLALSPRKRERKRTLKLKAGLQVRGASRFK